MDQYWRPTTVTPVSSAGRVSDERRARLATVDPRTRGTLLFDWDGTLCDTRAGIMATARTALLRWGMAESDLGDLSRLTGPTFPYAFSEVYGVSEQEAREISDIYHGIYDELGPEARPLFPGTRELLVSLSEAGKTLVVASSKRQHKLDAMVDEAGLRELFVLVVGAIHPERVNKQQVIGHVLQELSVRADDCVMIGDRFYDVEGAASVGVPCVGADFGTSQPGELAAAGACAVASDAAELARILL
jgi:phosphoglycolate phosphatase